MFYRIKKWLSTPAKYTAMGIAMLFSLGPLYWILTTSLKPMGAEYKLPIELWPSEVTFQAYRQVVTELDFLINIRNSFIVSSVVTVVSVILAGLSAYAIARLRFKYKVQSLLFLQLGGMIPPVVTIAPTFTILRSMGLLRTLPGLIVPMIIYNVPLGTWLLASYFANLPFELDDAAKVDGYRPFQIFYKVILPIASPGLFSAGVFAFIFSWGQFILANTVLMGVSEVQTVPVAIQNFSANFRTQWTWISAGIVLSLIPIILLVIIFQRWVIRGMTAGAVKH